MAPHPSRSSQATSTTAQSIPRIVKIAAGVGRQAYFIFFSLFLLVVSFCMVFFSFLFSIPLVPFSFNTFLTNAVSLLLVQGGPVGSHSIAMDSEGYVYSWGAVHCTGLGSAAAALVSTHTHIHNHIHMHKYTHSFSLSLFRRYTWHIHEIYFSLKFWNILSPPSTMSFRNVHNVFDVIG